VMYSMNGVSPALHPVSTSMAILSLEDEDDLRSPSARIVTGQLLNNGGTGAFDLLQKPDYLLRVQGAVANGNTGAENRSGWTFQS